MNVAGLRVPGRRANECITKEEESSVILGEMGRTEDKLSLTQKCPVSRGIPSHLKKSVCLYQCIKKQEATLVEILVG